MREIETQGKGGGRGACGHRHDGGWLGIAKFELGKECVYIFPFILMKHAMNPLWNGHDSVMTVCVCVEKTIASGVLQT